MLRPFHEAQETSPPSAPPVASVTQRALRWLLESGIQDSQGGVARYYRTDTTRFHPISTEITGYTVSTLVYLHHITGRGDCLDAACRAGRYLTNTAWNAELSTMPFECGDVPQRAYFFDLGIIARGLLSLWGATGDSEYLNTARGCALSMAEDFKGPASYHPVLSLPGKQPVPGDGRWSLNPGCYQLKAALAWRELALACDGDDFLKLYQEAAHGFLDSHHAFPEAEAERLRVVDRLHSYCYFLEGLLPLAVESIYAQTLRDGIKRVSDLLRDMRAVFERTDVYAQLLRLRLYADSLGIAALHRENAEEEAAALESLQLLHTDPRLDGAFGFGRRSGSEMPFANPVSTAFAVQALEMWAQYRAGQFSAEISDLI